MEAIKKIAIIIPLAVAIAISFYLVRTRPSAESTDVPEGLRKVRYMQATPVTIQKLAFGYGRVIPAHEWTGICEVKGKITVVGKAVEEGHIIAKGSVICKIDTQELELVATQRRLSIQQLEIQRKELQEEKRNAQKLLEIDRKQIELLDAEYQRKKRLLAQDTSSQVQVEVAEQNLLKQKNVLQQRENSLELLDLKLENTKTSLDVAKTQLQLAKIDLSKTELVAPFDMRITYENLEPRQFVSPGQVLVKGHAIDEMEVWGQFKYSDIREVLWPHGKIDAKDALGISDSEDLLAKLGISGEVRPMIPEQYQKEDIVWKADLVRFRSAVDAASQTATVVMRVKDSYRDAITKSKPPLVKDMFCEVTVFGDKDENRFCLPRAAFYNGEVLLFKEQKLHKKKVKLLYFQGDYAVVDGLSAADQIILSDIFPAVEGMHLVGVDATDEIKSAYPWFIDGGKK